MPFKCSIDMGFIAGDIDDLIDLMGAWCKVSLHEGFDINI